MKKTYKKITIMMLAISMSFNLVSCNKTNNIDSVETTQAEELPPSIPINSINDINSSIKLGSQNGTTNEKWTLTNSSGASVAGYRTNDELISGLLNGGVDAVVMDELTAKYYVSKNSRLKLSDIKFLTDEYGIGFSKEDDTLRQDFNSALKQYKDDGSMTKLLDAYMPLIGDVVVPDDISMSGANVVKVGVSSDFYPFAYIDNGKLVGFDITLLTMFASDNGYNFEFVDMSFDKLFDSLENGTVDVIASGITISEERHDYVNFSNSYFETEQVIIVRA